MTSQGFGISEADLNRAVQRYWINRNKIVNQKIIDGLKEAHGYPTKPSANLESMR